jgi:hypothetical protein
MTLGNMRELRVRGLASRHGPEPPSAGTRASRRLERLKHIYVCGKGRTSDNGLQLPLEEVGPDRRPHPSKRVAPHHVGDRDPLSRPCGLRNRNETFSGQDLGALS